MKALTWQGKRDVRVEDVPDPRIEEPTDAIIAVTSTAICGSDLHLYEVLGPYMKPGDILGHEPMGIVEEVGPGVTDLKAGDRVVVPFNISCGHCWMCPGLTPSARRRRWRAGQGRGAVRLHLAVRLGPGRAGRVPARPAGPVRPDQGRRTGPDERLLYLSDVLPTAWQAVEYADVARGRHPRRLRARADRPDLRPDRPAPRGRAGDRGRPGARAAGHGRPARRRDARPDAWTATTSRRADRD